MQRKGKKGKECHAAAIVLVAGAAGCVFEAVAVPWGGQVIADGELLQRLFLLLATCALTALVEEIVFRGIILDLLLRVGKAATGVRRVWSGHVSRVDVSSHATGVAHVSCAFRGRPVSRTRRLLSPAAFHVKHLTRRCVPEGLRRVGERWDAAQMQEPHEGSSESAVLVAAVVVSAAVFALAHIVPAPGQPWPGGAAEVAAAVLKVGQALLFGIAMAGLRIAALSRSPCACDTQAALVPVVGGESAPGAVLPLAAAPVARAFLTPVAGALGAAHDGAGSGPASAPGDSPRWWIGGLRVPIGVHFGFDVFYFAPAVLSGGAFPLTYLGASAAEWAAAGLSAMILLWPAAWALGLARCGVIPYDDDQEWRTAEGT